LDVELNYNEIGKIVSKTETISGENINYQYSYDKRGRLTKVIKNNQTVEEYTYDTFGELTSVITPNHNIDYIYNGLQQRIAKIVDGEVTEKYLWLL